MKKPKYKKLTWDIIANTPYMLADVRKRFRQKQQPGGFPQSPPVRVDGECLIMSGDKGRRGYSSFSFSNCKEYGYYEFKRDAHVMAWILSNGREPNEKLEIGHLCGNSRCTNPKHLAELTHEENMLLATMNRSNPREETKSWRVSNGDAMNIRQMFYELGWTRKLIHYHFRMQYSYRTIIDIISGKIYRIPHQIYLERFEKWRKRV